MRKTIRSGALAILSGTWLLAAGLLPATCFAQDMSLGQQYYKNFCAACHGIRGRGDGIMAQVLTRKPADLSALERNNGGKFPMEKVVATIDGRFMVPGHGERMMPIWGDVFRQENKPATAPNGVELSAQDRILALAYYIRSLQQRQ